MLEQLNSVFFEEANELLDNLEEQLLTLEEHPDDTETISAVFRAMHTIKGSSAMFGFNDISSFTHEAESAMDQVRNGFVPVKHELIDLLLKARDHIHALLDAGSEIPPDLNAASQELINAFIEYVVANGGNSSKGSAPAAQTQASVSSQKEETWRIKFRPSNTIMQNGTRPELLVKELTEMGKATVVPFYTDLPSLSEMDSELCYFAWDIILTTNKSENDINDVFIFLDSESHISVEKIDIDPSSQTKIGEILVNRNDITKEELDKIINEHKQLGQILVEKKIVSQQQVTSALAEQKHIKSVQPAEESSIRVSSKKLDQLLDLVGELVTFNARLDQLAIRNNMVALKNLSENCGRLVVMLRDTSMDMRMVPIGTLFTRFRRTVRDLGQQLGKDIEMETEGSETEMDKNVIEKLNDPLLHLIRNSVDHGVESPVERKAAGKPEQGRVVLSAKHSGAFVMISIIDDGQGLDKEAIRQKGIERSLITADQQLTDNEIYNLIFLPGFSTSKQVTSVSGRGVGLDVVKKDIATLGGSVEIETEKGKGTTFILKIPLTLAIIDGMLVSVGSVKYIIPLNTINECLSFKQTVTSDSRMFPKADSHGKDVPSLYLRSFFHIHDPLPQRQEVVTILDQKSLTGIVVDKILGNQQIVIKPLSKLYKNCTGINGAAVLGDGSVALILDVLKLTELIHIHEKG